MTHWSGYVDWAYQRSHNARPANRRVPASVAASSLLESAGVDGEIV